MKYYIKTALITACAISIYEITFYLRILYPELKLIYHLLRFGAGLILIIPLNKYFRQQEIIKKYMKEI